MVVSEGITLMRDRNFHAKVSMPEGKPWITSLVLVKPDRPREVQKKVADGYQELYDFLQGRSLWVGTREDGLWRFQDGKWSHFDQSNTNLPSQTINRLYSTAGRLIACTPGGLVMVSLSSQGQEEIERAGLAGGGPLADHFPAVISWSPYRLIVIAKDFWVSADSSLCRFPMGTKPAASVMAKTPGLSASMEEIVKPPPATDQNPGPSAPPSDKPGKQQGNPSWTVYSKDDHTLPSNQITRMVNEDGGGLWMVFQKTSLYRMRIILNPRRKKTTDPVRIVDWLKLGGSIKRFSSMNADFESNLITAIAVNKGAGNGVGLWVACDEEPWGFDFKPCDRDMTHLQRKVYKNMDDIGAMDGTSLHYYDGLTWDKWWISRMLCMAIEGNYLWMGTMQRLRQLRMDAWTEGR